MRYPLVALGVILLHFSWLVSCQQTKDILIPKQEQKVQVEFKERRSKFKFIPLGGILSCPKKYIGIGLRFDWGPTNVVVNVAPNSPADKAGIQIGDILLKDEWYGSLEVGQEVELPIERNGVQILYKMKVNYICYDE